MTINDIVDEFEKQGRLSRKATEQLRVALHSDEAYHAITVAADIGAVELAPDVATSLTSADSMVRWNAAATLFTRFRNKTYAPSCLKLANADPDELVRSVSICGLGELLPFIEDQQQSITMAKTIYDIFSDHQELPEMRSAAYEAILAAQDVLPLDRPAASRSLDLEKDVDQAFIDSFRKRFLHDRN